MNLLYETMSRAVSGFNVKAHQFSDVRDICKKKHVNLTLCEYGPDILGYFCIRRTAKRIKRFIVVNSLLDDIDRTFIGLHELGHFFLHQPVSTSQWLYCRRMAKGTQAKHDAEADAAALVMMIPLWLMIDLEAVSFADVDARLMPYLIRRKRLWEVHGF